MFKKLRNRLILINLGVTSIVILIVFSVIYVASTRMADNRAPMFKGFQMADVDGDGVPEEFKIDENEASEEFGANTEEMPENFGTIIINTVREEKRAAANSLLIALVISGVAIELTVALVSYFMAEEAIKPVREAYDAQKIFIANASHEIKTPLAAIAANLEAADISDNKWISNVEVETAKLTALNTSLLTLARSDLMNQPMTATEVDLYDLVGRAVNGFEPRMGVRRLTVVNKAPHKVKLNGEDLSQILGILLDNAVKYSDSKITVRASLREISVENDGRTIAPEKLPHIFERFYQVDKSAEGVGLGLSIAASLAERNGWKLTAESEKTTKFVLSF